MRLVSLVERRTIVREDEGSTPDRTNTRGLKITEENVLLCNYICKWLDILDLSEKDDKP